MKPKTGKISKAKKAPSKSLKPSVSAASIRKTLKNVIAKELLGQPTSTLRNQRARDVKDKAAKEKPSNSKPGTRNKVRVPNDHGAAGGSQESVKSESSKRQKTSLLEIPKLPTRQGTVFVMGENDAGQLGLKDVDEKLRPTELPLDEPIVDIVAGGMHSVCLSSSGKVYTFGCNDEGALGRDDDSEWPPRIVDLPERIVMVSAGDSHTAALSETGKVYLWGNFRDSSGSMGLTPNGQKIPTPIRILENVTVAKIASGVEHLVCLSSDGDVYTCGCAEFGRLGRLTPRSSIDGGRTGGIGLLLNPNVVRPVGKQTKKFDDVWTGHYSTFIHERNSENIYVFGLNNYHQLGYPKDERTICIYSPKRVVSLSNARIISGGQHHTLLLNKSGCVYCFGREEYGRLGLGEDSGDAENPTLIPTLQREKCCDVSSGNCASFAVSTSGKLYSWGMGNSGVLGHGNENDKFVPTVVEGRLDSWNVFKTSGGGQHTLVLADN